MFSETRAMRLSYFLTYDQEKRGLFRGIYAVYKRNEHVFERSSSTQRKNARRIKRINEMKYISLIVTAVRLWTAFV